MIFNLRKTLFRIWYRYVNSVDRNAEVLFMNWGYSDGAPEIPLEDADRPNRYSIQLYHHLASAVGLEGRDIVEVGCGRGGGLSYVARRFGPATAIGVDLDRVAISFCRRHYKSKGLSFVQGDAQHLSLPNGSADVVMNVESSHRYPNMAAFLGEVWRILRPKGYFLFTDFRHDHRMDDFARDLAQSGLTVIDERNINEEVLAALRLDDARRRHLVQKLAPRPLHGLALNFAGVVGSETYHNLQSRKYVYFSYILQKP